ncbi:FAD-dependent oxidoreductase [Castellaniella sp. S9]|uniref:FAD-dependent oxidoreductase n=1 Tax=Castellaniella sp. S9 TaxID=2993652 RepID=UPI0022B2F1D6|nr:FAD-dependent oxidoreductase [Castellaniella sp. S9]
MNPTPQPSITEPARQTPVIDEVDVLVLGGGPAGLAAAASAARCGARTLLVERYGFLGGMGTAAGVTNFCGLHANVHGVIRRVVQGVGAELLERIDALGGLNAPHLLFGARMAAQAYDTAAYKVAADELLAASGARVLLHAWVAGVLMRDTERLDAIVVETKSGRAAIRAQYFIDCTGDGDVAAFAGVPYEKGADGEAMMYPSTMMRIGGVDPVRAGEAWRHVAGRMQAAQARGETFTRQGPILRPQKNPTEWRANVTQLARADGGPVDGTDAWQLSAAEGEGRRQAAHFLGFLRRDMPGFEDAYLLDLPPQLGIRETRRIVGDYVLSEDDVLQCASFDDTVGVNGWPVEEHAAGRVEWRWPHGTQDAAGRAASRGYNHLPWRMLLPRGMDNLLVAGRCASMTHGGQSAARVSGACFVMGQAAGTGSALALRRAIPPRRLPAGDLQDELRRAGAWLGLDGDPLPAPI